MRHAPRSGVLGRADMPAYLHGLRPWLAARAACHPPWPLSGQAPSRTLLLTAREEWELVEVNGLVTGSAAAGPAAQDGLQEQHRLRQCQAGRGAFGSRRSRVRKACAQV